MNSSPFPVLTTSRLLLRKLVATDWAAVSYLRTDQEVNKYVNRPAAKNQDEALQFINKITSGVDSGESFYWAISPKDTDEMIGSICLWNVSADRLYAEVGYDLKPEFQGEGIMKEALNAVLHFGFSTLKLNTIEAYTHHHNEASKKLLLKAGFQLVLGKKDQDNANNRIFVITRPAGLPI